MDLDRRQHQRFACDLDAEVCGNGQVVSAQTDDVSGGGICLRIREAFALGTQVQISLTLVLSASAMSEALVLPAQIVWCTPVGQEFQIGCKFHVLNQEQSQYLELFLRFLSGDALTLGETPEEIPTLDVDDSEEPDCEPFR